MGHLQYSLEDFEEEEKKAQERNTGTGTYVLFQLSEFGTRFLKTLQTDQVRIRIRNTSFKYKPEFYHNFMEGECRMVVSYHLFFSHQVKQFVCQCLGSGSALWETQSWIRTEDQAQVFTSRRRQVHIRFNSVKCLPEIVQFSREIKCTFCAAVGRFCSLLSKFVPIDSTVCRYRYLDTGCGPRHPLRTYAYHAFFLSLQPFVFNYFFY